MFPDIFNDDAFSLVNLTALISGVDHVPGRAGEVAFAGVGEGVSTITVSIEQVNQGLSLINTTPRYAPAPKETQDKGVLKAISIPQVKLEDTIPVSSVMGVRELGSADQLRSMMSVVSSQMTKMSRRHDMTLEHLRLGALQGKIYDADATLLYDLFDLFGVIEPTAVEFGDVLVGSNTEGETVRTRAQEVTRFMRRNLKAPWPGSAGIWSFVGDNFFDRLVESTKHVYQGWEMAQRMLGDNYAHGVYEFGGVFWENYRGTDDNSTVAIGQDQARFFPVGVPGLYVEYYAPADFAETINTIGVPRYAKAAPDGKFNRSFDLHTQQNPLPLCTRPRVLMTGEIST